MISYRSPYNCKYLQSSKPTKTYRMLFLWQVKRDKIKIWQGLTKGVNGFVLNALEFRNRENIVSWSIGAGSPGRGALDFDLISGRWGKGMSTYSSPTIESGGPWNSDLSITRDLGRWPADLCTPFWNTHPSSHERSHPRNSFEIWVLAFWCQ